MTMKNIAVIAISVVLLISCSKYEEGPKFTLRSKKERLANNWKVDKYFKEDIEQTETFKTNFKNYLFSISKGGTYVLSYDSAVGGVFYDEGIWRFVSGDKTRVEYLSNRQGALVKTFTILKLKDKEAWYYTNDKGFKEEFRMKPQ